LSVVVFYDENGNGVLDPEEKVSIPAAVVEVRREAEHAEVRTEKGTGLARIDGLPAGTHVVSVRAASLPPFYRPGKPIAVAVPAPLQVPLPASLPIGSNRRNTYMAFGDSISEGVGSSDDTGYCRRLEARLRGHFGVAVVEADGMSGTDSHRGARRVGKALARHRPSATLVLYGTNDWDETGTETLTVNSLRRIVRQVKVAHSLPFLATLIPTNVGSDARASAERNRWVDRINTRIRGLAREEGAVLVDLEAAFARVSEPKRFYSDGLHPNDAGYEVIAATFFDAITRR
jgi:lysophospholipase L1-like esterase